MHPKVLPYLPKQGPLYSVIGTLEIQTPSVQLLAICLCLVSIMLQGKEAVECSQPWPRARLGVRAEIIALCKFRKPTIDLLRTSA